MYSASLEITALLDTAHAKMPMDGKKENGKLRDVGREHVLLGRHTKHVMENRTTSHLVTEQDAIITREKLSVIQVLIYDFLVPYSYA